MKIKGKSATITIMEVQLPIYAINIHAVRCLNLPTDLNDAVALLKAELASAEIRFTVDSNGEV